MKFSKTSALLLAAAMTISAGVLGAGAAQAYAPTPGPVYQVPNDQPCLKGRGNCAIYTKSAELPNGDLVAAFERSTVVAASGTADGQTIPVYRSTDSGDTWQPLSEVPAPAYLSDDPKYDAYVSNWTNPYFYVLPQQIGSLAAGTLLLSTVVSGDDEYYKERKAADPTWVPDNDGDRSNVAIALYSSTDNGVTWSIVDIVAQGGWQGGSAGAIGRNIAAANATRQVDPLWEPHLRVFDNKLVVYYSDENDYIGWDRVTGEAIEDPANDTAADSFGQVLVHKTWDGASWSKPTIDVTGRTEDRGNGKTQIGGGRPGMTTIADTADGKYIMMFEYFGEGPDGHYKTGNDPLRFRDDTSSGGLSANVLPVTSGSAPLSAGGNPVLVNLPDGRIAYNSGYNGDVWINESGRSDGSWTQFQVPIGAGYSRTIQPVTKTGRVIIFQAAWGGAGSPAVINRAEVDFGNSAGEYVQLVNRKTGQVLGTGGNITDANIGNNTQPDIRLEDPRTDGRADTQQWHVKSDTGGSVTLLNKSGGREAAIWTRNATAGQRIASWVDNVDGGLYRVVDRGAGRVAFQSTQNPSLYLSGQSAGAFATLQPAATDGADEWTLVSTPALPADAVATTRKIASKVYVTVTVTNNATVPVNMTVSTAYGQKSFTSVQPGKKVSAAINTQKASIPAGTATVTSSATIDGRPVTSSIEAPYGALN
ncbi:RICIN domain-containing protein [uncultured Microbacterium sp.]|uniref:RICIN domain-containing protein n=1 Tax=uncultured Microbacterium sp. TaxID=191216 RepID=UPI0028D00A12|nr:RICIN domain-containing protein [uncultured Microbacterium sp.]